MIPVRTLGLGEQLAYMRLWWPQFRCSKRGPQLTATGRLQPTELSEEYEVEVRQHGGRSPEVRVLEPELQRGNGGEEIPHMYSQQRLCLFLPGAGEWKPEDPIALTILPWTSLWLTFYETWHTTGEWLGGGVHPNVPITIRKRKNGRDDWNH